MRQEQDVLNPEFQEDQINGIEINVQNADGRLIETETEKEIRAEIVSVLFIIRVSISDEGKAAFLCFCNYK